MSHGGSLYWWNAEEEQWEHPAMAFRMSPTVTLWMKCPQLPESMSWERQEVQDGEK
jgi:ParB family chromosome partitioning protein